MDLAALFKWLSFFGLYSVCLSLTLVPDNELAVEIDNRVNKEINFDRMLQKYNLTSFRVLLVQAKLFDVLNVTTTSYTVFAPTNDAIQKAKTLLTNATRLPEILQYHVHKGPFRTAQIQSNMRLQTLLGKQKKIRLERYRGINYGSCQQFGSVIDETYNNGIMDTMNGVMNPPEGNFYDLLKATSTFSQFLKYVNLGDLQPMMAKQTPMTLLLPNDDAFAKLPTSVAEKMQRNYNYLVSVIHYHVLQTITCLNAFETGKVTTFEGSSISVAVSGGKVVFNSNVTIIQSDIIAYNGVIQIIDQVLLPAQLY